MQPLTISLLLLAAFALPAAQALDVGVAACDITPDVTTYQVPLAGYGARQGKPAEGVHDPLKAKVLYLRDGKTEVALITCDLRSITPEFVNQIAEKSRSLGSVSDALFVCASHTHAGPSMYPQSFWQFQFGVYEPAIVEIMSTSVAHALAEAVKNAAPARIGFGETQLKGFTHNRRWGYDTATRETAGEKPQTNPRLWVMRVDDTSGKCRAVLVNFATHPTIAGADNMRVSAEWPGVLQRKLENAIPGAVVLYSNGAEGDQSPEGATGSDDFARIEDFGTRLADEARKVAEDITTSPDLSVSMVHRKVDLPEITFSEGARSGPYVSLLQPAMEALPRKTDLWLLRIGDTVLVGLPGEPLCTVGMATEKAVRDQGFKQAIVVGLSSDYIGYIVNAQEYAHAGYEVDSRSYYGPGLGAFLVDQAGKAAGDMRAAMK